MQGILVKNLNGDILISSDAETLHFGGLARFHSYVVGTGLLKFPDYHDPFIFSRFNGRTIIRYHFYSSVPPIFFIKPFIKNTWDLEWGSYYGILQQFNVGNDWYVDIIMDGWGDIYNDGTPRWRKPIKVLAFVTALNIPVPSGDNMGIATYLEDGRVAFDSRLLPLAVVDAQEVWSPELPCNDLFNKPRNESGFEWNDATLDYDFRCNNYNIFGYRGLGNIPYQHLMFSAPSVAQAVYSRQKNGYKSSAGDYGDQRHWSTAVWWVMYQQAYGLFSDGIHGGWCTYAAGYWFSSTWESAGWYNGGGGSGSVLEGSRPFNDKAINMSPNTIILADSRPYL